MTSPATPVGPLHFLLQTSDLQLRQVSRALLSSAPEWWRAQYAPSSGSLPPPKPLRTHLDLPVFAIDVPVAVLDVFLEMIQVPELVEDYWQHAPAALGLKLRSWRGHMRAYGFTSEEDLDAEAAPPPAKKRGVMTPFDAKLEAVATLLHEHIFAHHPKAARFREGLEKSLFCNFATCCKDSAYHAVRSYDIPVDSALHDFVEGPTLEVAHFLDTYLDDSHKETVVAMLRRLSPPGTHVAMKTALEYQEKVSKKAVLKREFCNWPLTAPVTLGNDAYHVLTISFWYQ